jgi:hypothetical protein
VLHWLLPDWQWQLEDQTLTLQDQNHQVELAFSAELTFKHAQPPFDDLALIRAGETLTGKRQNPILGWVSDTYGSKIPALSLSITCYEDSDLRLVGDWKFTHQKA